MAAAAQRRDAAWGRVATFSPKVFLPLTNLCRNACDYCSFRRSPGQPGAWTMRPDEIESWLGRAHALGCVEALFCLGDTPESVFPSYRATLSGWGHDSTVDYLVWAGARALDLDLLPHTNAGLLSRADMARLETVNASLGLMLESVSARLCDKGMPHHRAPDKRPEKRLAMLHQAGELRVPFTTGILIGIGETEHERIESLLAIRDLHRRHGHIQEVIVQPFRARPDIPMHDAAEPAGSALTRTVALARLILDDDVALQAPPNLSPASTAALLAAGINDFGGISPVTPDYINPRHPWPHLDALADACAASGFALEPRAPVYEHFIDRPGFLTDTMRAHVRRIGPRLAPLRAALARARAGACA
jgi:FO synthase